MMRRYLSLRIDSPHRCVHRHFDDILLLHGLQGVEEVTVLAVTFVCREPIEFHQPMRLCAAEQLDADLWFGLEGDVFGHRCRGTTLSVARPSLGQIQLLFQQGASPRRDT
jgi:hypothetical protein